MYKLLLLLSIVITIKTFDWGLIGKIIECIVSEHTGDVAFKSWHQIHKKQYKENSDEWIKRNALFIAKHERIKAHNAQNKPYKLKLNEHSDLTDNEHKKRFGFVRNQLYVKRAKTNPQLNGIAIDYRYQLSGVRDQGQCGSCWTFSTTGAIEANVGMKFGANHKYLSVQQLIDCDENDNGCDGGNFLTAFTFLNNTGIVDDSNYQYHANQKQCNYNISTTNNVLRGIDYCSDFEEDNQCSNQRVYDLLSNGALSVPIDGGSFEFQNYASGIITVDCIEANHAVVLVGYGSDEIHGEYWIIRNSWGSTWGENGYAKIAVNHTNNESCFITSEAYLPLV